MAALSAALSYRRLADDNPTLRMLRADNVAVMAAVLDIHLSGPGVRLNTDDTHERIDAELEELRDYFDLSNRTAKAYCDDWRNAGILIRRPATEARGETYELSASGFDAITILKGLVSPRSTVTESRLVSLATALQQLAIDTDPDSTRRLAALERERDRLDAEIDKIHRGETSTMDERRARERVTDILAQAQGLPADFARVRAQFEHINHELRASILNSDDTQGVVLDDIFRGVDLIESSDEGRTFTAFSSLIRDPERAAAFDEDVAAILSREFAPGLTAETRRALRSLMREMKDGSRDVHGILTEFARGLRRYVYSQEFQRDRALRPVLQEALAAAFAARTTVRAHSDIGAELELSSMRLSTVGEIQPHDPSELDAGPPLDDDVPNRIDFAALAAIARESEIDFTELTNNINDVLSHARAADPAAADPAGRVADAANTDSVTIAEVLAQHPATQGVASIIGLISLATQYGIIDHETVDELTWTGTDGIRRAATIERHIFTEKVDA